VEQSASFVIITDVEGKIEYVNQQLLRTMGYTADEVIGRKPALWRSDRTSEREYAELWQTILAGHDWRGEFENSCKDGSLLSVSATISPIKDQSGRITHFIGIQEDITQRRALEDQLRQAQKMEAVGQLTGGLAHDFNNLLTVSIGNLDLLQEEFEANPRAREMLRLALGASLRGAELTRQLLAFSRRQSLEPKVFDLNGLVAGTTDLLRRTLGEQIEIELTLADGLQPALADPAQVESALVNVAINARDAMPNGGRLTIETAKKRLDARYAAQNVEVAVGDYVMLAVSDTGTGIPPEILDKVFEPFFTSKEKGTGLGLSMVYGFAKQSGGHVKISSEVGHGTTVRLYLPQAGSDATSSSADPVEAVDDRPCGATVLVVEDDADVRNVAVSQLTALGYRVVEAADGKAALKLLGEGRSVDLLFTDVMMPGGMSGPDLAREARMHRPALKVLFTSGYAEAALGNGARVGEIGGLISKPYRKEDLGRKVREALSGGADREKR
jgi:PAS domain S-box-containing protein